MRAFFNRLMGRNLTLANTSVLRTAPLCVEAADPKRQITFSMTYDKNARGWLISHSDNLKPTDLRRPRLMRVLAHVVASHHGHCPYRLSSEAFPTETALLILRDLEETMGRQKDDTATPYEHFSKALENLPADYVQALDEVYQNQRRPTYGTASRAPKQQPGF